jgi:small subunit ribosomal protein S13
MQKLQLGKIPSDKDELLSNIIRDPAKYKIPTFVFNRQKDIYSGKDRHIVNADLAFEKREDLQRLSKIKSRRGLRLLAGLPVRGQRTKSNYRRKGGKVIGVEKKKK